MPDTQAWVKAEQHVRGVLSHYKDAVGLPMANMDFGIMVLESLLRRYASGERSEDLYEEMVDAE